MTKAEDWLYKGDALVDNGDYETALVAYKRAIELGADSYAVYFNLALVLRNLSLNQDALIAIQEAILREPNRSEAYASKAWTLLGLGRKEEARNACKQALRLNSKNEFAAQLDAFLRKSP